MVPPPFIAPRTSLPSTAITAGSVRVWAHCARSWSKAPASIWFSVRRMVEACGVPTPIEASRAAAVSAAHSAIAAKDRAPEATAQMAITRIPVIGWRTPPVPRVRHRPQGREYLRRARNTVRAEAGELVNEGADGRGWHARAPGKADGLRTTTGLPGALPPQQHAPAPHDFASALGAVLSTRASLAALGAVPVIA